MRCGRWNGSAGLQLFRAEDIRTKISSRARRPSRRWEVSLRRGPVAALHATMIDDLVLHTPDGTAAMTTWPAENAI